MFKPSRRTLLRLAAGAMLMPALARAAEVGLARIAASRGLAFGTMIEPRSATGDGAAGQLTAENSGLVTDAQFHWAATTPSPGAETLVNADRMLAWAEHQHLSVRGHALLWHLQTPDWWSRGDAGAPARQALTTHVDKLVRRYAGRISCWDVVNEVVRAGDRADGLRDSPLVRLAGADYVDLAFHTAHAADPLARLACNDYGMEVGSRTGLAKRAAFLKLISRLKAKGVPLTTVGIQSHLDVGLPDFDETGFRAFLREVAGHGVDIVLSELDVTDRTAPMDITLRDQMVADTYRRYLDVALDEPKVSAVVCWGLSDRYSWISDLSLPEHRRTDGAPPRPCLFDQAFQAKPACAAVAAALAAAPVRIGSPI